MKCVKALAGEVVDVFSSVSDGEDNTVIVQTENMEISRLHLPAGTRIPTYEAQGEIVIICMEGNIEVDALGKSQMLTSGQSVYLKLNEPFSMTAQRESSLLLVVVSVTGSPRGTIIGEWTERLRQGDQPEST